LGQAGGKDFSSGETYCNGGGESRPGGGRLVEIQNKVNTTKSEMKKEKAKRGGMTHFAMEEGREKKKASKGGPWGRKRPIHQRKEASSTELL